jgi:hypothetical protein
VAKTLDSGGGLAPWKAAMTAGGLIMRPGLKAQWEALLAAYGDPWYAGEQAKAATKALVEESANVGGANDRRDIGSALHTITALVDAGKAVPHLSEETRADLDAYVSGREAAGIEVLPGQIEVTVVLDSIQVAGTLDRIVTVPGFGLPLVADLKTGANLEYSWQSIAVQLAAYAHAEAVYHQGAAADGSQDVREAFPAVDQTKGLIFWLNAGAANLELYLVDLVAGWEAFQHSMWTRAWRNQNVSEHLEPGLEVLLARSLEAAEATKHRHRAAQPELSLRDWLQARIDRIGQDDRARRDLAGAWPTDMPTLRSREGHSPAQLVVIEQLCDDVERRWQLEFPPPRPTADQASEDEAVANIHRLFPHSQEIRKP